MAKPKSGSRMPRREKTDAQLVAEGKRILDEVDAMDPDDPSLAPWQTENWRRKGWPLGKAMGPLFKPKKRKGGK